MVLWLTNMALYTIAGSLMLWSALLDWSTACPLIHLQPPELVQEFGEDTFVNCTTTVDGHRGMYWTYGSEKEYEDPDSFTVLDIPRVDWNTKAKCTIKYNDTYECSKDLEIKVYKRPTSITVQSNGPALDGNQLELNCEVSDVGIIKNLTVTWYINNTKVETEFYQPTTNTTTNVASSLMWNVNREHHGTTFTCEASELGPHGPLYVSNATWELSVQYAPEFEEDEYHKEVDNSAVNLHCEAIGNPPPHYIWIKDGVTVANNTNYLNVSEGQVYENTTFECVASNDHGSAVKRFIVTVLDNETTTPTAPKSSGCPLTLSPDKILVEFGGPASANCSTTEADADGLGWEATSDGIGLTAVTQLEWRVKKVEKWDIAAICFINLNNGSHCTKPLSITVWKSPDKVLLSPNGSSLMEEGKPHQLKCNVFNVAPVEKLQVNWYQDEKLIHTDSFNVPAKNKTPNPTPKNVTSIFDLTPTKEHNEANFKCEAELLLEQQGHKPNVSSKPFTANVQYKPTILDCPGNYAGREDDFQLDTVPCAAKGNPEPDIHWYYKGKLVNSTERLSRGDSGTYKAKFTNIIGDTSATVNITVEYGPSFSCKDHYNVIENVTLGHECEPEGIPKPESVWFKDGNEIALPKMWNRQDTGEYTIVATDKHRQANHTLSINVLYIPRFSEDAITIELNLGDNLTLECSADGNPPPLLHWSKHPTAANINVGTRGRQSYINITEATSSNAGVYSCTATNEVGSVTKNVTLMITGRARNVNNTIIICVALAALLVLIFFLVLFYRNYKKKSGHYNVAPPSEGVPLKPTRSSVV